MGLLTSLLVDTETCVACNNNLTVDRDVYVKINCLCALFFQHQRDELWHMVFGEAPVKAITSPFMLSTEGMTDEVTQHTPHCGTIHKIIMLVRSWFCRSGKVAN